MCAALVITSALAAPTTNSNNNTSGAVVTTTLISTSSSSSSSLSESTSISTRSGSLLHQTLLEHSPASNSRLRKRHSKRHSRSYIHNDLNENSTVLEWENPCGGYYDPTAVAHQRPKRINQKKIYNALKLNAGHEFKLLKDSQQAIDINNFEMWSIHKRTYKFLPKLKKNNSSIALKRWYGKMQTYVASFAYLWRIQLKWERSKEKSDKASELNTLLISSRNILCELETAVNKTHPFQRQKRQLPQVTRAVMNKRLKLRTRESVMNNPSVLQEANSIDLKFVKYYYYEFLENMWKTLRKYTKSTGQKRITTNEKKFNEVEKPFGKMGRKKLHNQNRRNQFKTKKQQSQ